MIKYIGSKRRLVPVLATVLERSGARDALDLFTGTTRVAQAFKERGATVTAVDAARCPATLASCYIATDASAVDSVEVEEAIARLDAMPGRDGYVTETFCRSSRYFQPHNGARIDAIREAIAREYAGSVLEPVLLTSLIEAADRVDSTAGVQMAYMKQWAPRSYRPLEMRVPRLLPGRGRALQGDACRIVGSLGPFDLAYLDPPYNQHRYEANYHVWETIVAWDEPSHYGVACKREDLRIMPRSPFNSRRTIKQALAGLIAGVDSRLLVLSYNDESFLSLEELVELCASRGHVAVLEFPFPRYVGARIGIHNPAGERVGRVGRLENIEYVIVAGERRHVERVVEPWRPGRRAESTENSVARSPGSRSRDSRSPVA